MTAFLTRAFLVGAWCAAFVAAVAWLARACREPAPPRRVCPPGCAACAVADDAVGARLDLDLWAMEMQEHTS